MLNFTQQIILPASLSQKYWDILFSIKVISEKDDSIQVGLFDRINYRNLLGSKEDAARFAFAPYIS